MKYHVLIKIGILVQILSVAVINDAIGDDSPPGEMTIQADSTFNVTSGDDIAQLHKLAAGVGWEFSPNQATSDKLKEIGIKYLRCINVDKIAGQFDASDNFVITGHPERLDQHLATCRLVGANPHVIIAEQVPDVLRINIPIASVSPGVMGQNVSKGVHWNGDWKRLRSYWKAIFQYVLIDQGFGGARFEVGNEPDIDNQVLHLAGVKGVRGSRALYENYLQLYRNASMAAQEFEQEHPGSHVTLGGPALAWAYTFKFGELNWLDQFIQDCSDERLKIDFLGVHFYGNVTSLHGEYPGSYPSFEQMWTNASAARDKYLPGVPIFITEWGPSYNTSNKPNSLVNANYIGAAWCAEFLSTMLRSGVDQSSYLVTTDLAKKNAGGSNEDIWGWPSLFVNPTTFQAAWPKAPLHVFEMIAPMSGHRLLLKGETENIKGIASASPENHSLFLLLWNYKAVIPEFKEAVDISTEEHLHIRVTNSSAVIGDATHIHFQQWRVSKNEGDAWQLYQTAGVLDERTLLKKINDRVDASASLGAAGIDVTLPPSAVTLLKIEPAP